MVKNKRQSTDIIALLVGKGGMRNRLDANCVSCVYDEAQPGSWREQVQNCSAVSCPIYPIRAKSKKKILTNTQEI